MLMAMLSSGRCSRCVGALADGGAEGRRDADDVLHEGQDDAVVTRTEAGDLRESGLPARRRAPHDGMASDAVAMRRYLL